VFDDRVWKAYRSAFISAQHGKCGYCEAFSLNHPGAIEHYAPKSEVQELTEPGNEHAVTANVQQRRTTAICASGYWWLAYDWDNWLFACERCNSGWKRCLFPVREPHRALPPTPSTKETALLLHPFGRIDPRVHLMFSSIGQIAARNRSDRGEATIRTCGLDRESLRRARQGITEDANRHAARLQLAVRRDDLRRALDAVDDLLSLGAERRAHAGMVRSIVSAKLDCTWLDLERLRTRLLTRVQRRDAGRR
jgi:hypothetical protein